MHQLTMRFHDITGLRLYGGNYYKPEDLGSLAARLKLPRAARAQTKGPVSRTPFAYMNPGDVFSCQLKGFTKYMMALGGKDVVLGLSGGLDSALALLVAVHTFDIIQRPRSGIHAYTMPGFGTTPRTNGNAHELCKALGVTLETIDITPACRQHFKDIGHDETTYDVTFENAQARMRTMILMDKANQLGGIVLGTGDMSEIALGWSTYNGDHISMFNVNAGVPKTVVRAVCEWYHSRHVRKFKSLKDILDTPVSPELLPAANGEITQKTEERLGPYELHDFFLWHFIALAEDRAIILRAARRAFRKTYDKATIAKWLDVFLRRIITQSFKRNCAPDGIKVFPEVYFSPADWHFPSVVRLKKPTPRKPKKERADAALHI